VPRHLRFNAFVHRGYRCGLSTRGCVRSVAAWHNETLNVWTHALAAAISLAALLTPWAPPGAPAIHAALRCAAALPMLLSFCLSVTYHTFMAHTRCCSARGGAKAYDSLLCADVAGVVGVLSVPQLPIVWYGFHSAPRLRNALLAAMALGAAGGARATRAVDQTARAGPLAALVAARLLALVLRLAGFGAECAQATRGYAALELIIGAGGIANALFLPERFFPGRLDYGINRRALFETKLYFSKRHGAEPACSTPHSHQIMHVCTTVGTVLLNRALREDYKCYAAATGE
jgi:adiponectin receptor